MKTYHFLALALFFAVLSSCENDNDFELVNVATPEILTFEELRTSVKVLGAKPIEESGKIYVKDRFILVNDIDAGIHIISNANPSAPQKIAFLEIPGNKDMEIKGTYLYADSYIDLVVFDLTNLENITEVARLENVFPYYAEFPGAEDIVIDATNYTYNEGLIVGWNVKQERRKIEDNPNIFRNMEAFSDATGADVGQGGSLARFKIVDHYLYAVDTHSINIFDIANVTNPVVKAPVFAGFDIETIFNRDKLLFLGSRSGMYTFDITEPETPILISEFWHGTACDPVVVDQQYAYITLRGGNLCGAAESTLLVVDISDAANPTLLKSYPMESPYGLGIKDNLLFVCDGEAGLKIIDKTNPLDLQLVNQHQDITAFDVIPTQEVLIMIGGNTLYQYEYVNTDIELLSTFSLN